MSYKITEVCRMKSQKFGVMPRARGLGLVRSRKSQDWFRKPNGVIETVNESQGDRRSFTVDTSTVKFQRPLKFQR